MMKSLIFAILTFMASPVFAGEVSYQVLPDGRTIGFYSGQVEQGDSQLLDAFLTEHPEVQNLVMNSPGGVSIEGYMLGRVISDHQLDVWVVPGGACISACATAFLGGVNYHVLGTLAFHVTYIADDSEASQGTPSQLLHAGQVEGARDVMYLISNGFTSNLAFYILAYTAPDVFIVFHNTEDLMAFYVRNDTDGELDDISNYYKNPVTDESFPTWIEEHRKTSTQIFEYMMLQRGVGVGE